MNDVERGGLSVEKQDSITGSTPQGDANFEGITFEIINNSRNPVMVEGQKYQPGEVVKTLVTDSEGQAQHIGWSAPLWGVHFARVGYQRVHVADGPRPNRLGGR